MRCPKCPDHQLSRVRTQQPLGLWSCQGCRGVWVPQGRATTLEPPQELERLASPLGEGKEHATGCCPDGHGLLIRAQTHVDEGFYLERCATCHGVWFDAGEWPRVAEAGLASGLFEIWDPAWQRERRAEREVAAYEAEIDEQLGANLVERIRAVADELRGHPARSLALGLLYRSLRQ